MHLARTALGAALVALPLLYVAPAGAQDQTITTEGFSILLPDGWEEGESDFVSSGAYVMLSTDLWDELTVRLVPVDHPDGSLEAYAERIHLFADEAVEAELEGYRTVTVEGYFDGMYGIVRDVHVSPRVILRMMSWYTDQESSRDVVMRILDSLRVTDAARLEELAS